MLLHIRRGKLKGKRFAHFPGWFFALFHAGTMPNPLRIMPDDIVPPHSMKLCL